MSSSVVDQKEIDVQVLDGAAQHGSESAKNDPDTPRQRIVEENDEENPAMSANTSRSVMSVGSEGFCVRPNPESQINMVAKKELLKSEAQQEVAKEEVAQPKDEPQDKEEEKKEEPGPKNSISSVSLDNESIPSEFSHSDDAELPRLQLGVTHYNPEIEAAPPATPDWITFIVDTLGFRREKIDLISVNHTVGSPEEFLDAFAPDKENGLHQHIFLPPTEADAEQKCQICDQVAKKHATFVTCKVCYEQKTMDQMFTLIACGHEFCADCTRDHLKKLIDCCEVAKLKCADYECRATFSEEEYRRILDEQTAAKMKRFVTALEVARDEDLFYCPNVECEIPLSLKECKKAQKKGPLVCSKCTTDICRKCLLRTHSGKPCVSQNEATFRIWATTGGVKNCPSCRARTEKNEGCNHMHCQRCGVDWCWICNQPANELHYEPNFRNIFKGCPGLQFRLGNCCALTTILILAFLFCGVVYIMGPILWGFFVPFALAGTVIERCCCRDFTRCMRRSPCWLKPFLCVCQSLCIVISFLIMWALLEAIGLSIGCVAGALAGAILTVPTMLIIVFFGVKLLCLRCRRLK